MLIVLREDGSDTFHLHTCTSLSFLLCLSVCLSLSLLFSRTARRLGPPLNPMRSDCLCQSVSRNRNSQIQKRTHIDTKERERGREEVNGDSFFRELGLTMTFMHLSLGDYICLLYTTGSCLSNNNHRPAHTSESGLSCMARK